MNVYYLSVLSYLFTYIIVHFKKEKHLHFHQVSLARGPGNFLVHWCSSTLGNLPIPNSYSHIFLENFSYLLLLQENLPRQEAQPMLPFFPFPVSLPLRPLMNNLVNNSRLGKILDSLNAKRILFIAKNNNFFREVIAIHKQV